MKRLLTLFVFLTAFTAKAQIITFTGGCYNASAKEYTWYFMKTGEGVSTTDVVSVTTNYSSELPYVVTPDAGSGGVNAYHYTYPKATSTEFLVLYVYVNGIYMGQQASDATPCDSPNNCKRRDKEKGHRGHHEKH